MKSGRSDLRAPLALMVVAGLALAGIANARPAGGNGNGNNDNSGSGGSSGGDALSGGSTTGGGSQNTTNIESVTLVGIVRDFQGDEERVTHPDFDSLPNGGAGVYEGLVAMTLDDDGKPAFVGQGRLVQHPWQDSAGHHIASCRYSEALGDTPGSFTGNVEAAGIQSDATFRQWFRDVPGVNLSRPIQIDLVRSQSGRFVFDDTMDELYSNRQGFFPINTDLFGNTPNEHSNYHFTYELEAQFDYTVGGAGRFEFWSTDDLWVFVNGHLVIDLGGTHNVELQTISLDRCDFITNGRNSLKIFLAERNRNQSNFRIDIDGVFMRQSQLPTTSALYD